MNPFGKRVTVLININIVHTHSRNQRQFQFIKWLSLHQSRLLAAHQEHQNHVRKVVWGTVPGTVVNRNLHFLALCKSVIINYPHQFTG